MKAIRWGMIGCGSVTEVKSGPGLYKAEHSALVAVSSTTPEKTRDYAKRHNISKAYASNEELLADPEIDIVYIATPPNTHKTLALQTAAAHKHVCLEKPMAMNYKECQDIQAACEKHGVRLFVAYYRRAMPRFVQIKQWIDSGAIGELRTVRVVQHMSPAADELDCNALPWRVKPQIAGGGKFLDMGVHTLDLMFYFFGPITTVHGLADNLGKLYEAEDTVSAIWQHKSGMQGTGSWCYVAGATEDWLQITGSKGRIECEVFSDKALVLVNEAGRHECVISNPQHVHQPFFQSIVNDLGQAGYCPGDVAEAMQVTLVADKILQKYRGR